MTQSDAKVVLQNGLVQIEGALDQRLVPAHTHEWYYLVPAHTHEWYYSHDIKANHLNK